MTIDLSTRAGLGRAITLIESRRPDHQAQARALLAEIMPRTGKAQRIGITGVPGVGKSTFIESFGTLLTGLGLRVAVLAVDPTSRRSGGSILGDKTRMAKLAADDNAFIRPSPAGDTLGGVSRKTRETMLVCEAAGYDVILVETVGVGQSETVVADMVDFFLVLMLPNAGDELQGIKKGVLEVADLIAVNKADIDDNAAKRAARAYEIALHIMEQVDPDWSPPVHTVSGFSGMGLAGTLVRHRDPPEENRGLRLPRPPPRRPAGPLAGRPDPGRPDRQVPRPPRCRRPPRRRPPGCRRRAESRPPWPPTSCCMAFAQSEPPA